MHGLTKHLGCCAATAVIAAGSQVMASTIDVFRHSDMTSNFRDHVNLSTAFTGNGSTPPIQGQSVLLPGYEVKDWDKWGGTAAGGGAYDDALLNSNDHKSGGTGQISQALTKVQTGTLIPARQNNNLFYHTWTDGAVTPSITDAIGGVLYKLDKDGIRDRDGSGFQLTVSNLVANTPYRLLLLAGGRHSTRTVTATLTDATTDFDSVGTATVSDGTFHESNYLIDFTPTLPGQTLTVSLTGVMNFDNPTGNPATDPTHWGDVLMSAAVLTSPIPEPATVTLLVVGGSLLGLRRRRRS